MTLIQSFSGIRGIYKKDLDEIIAKKYCQAYLQFLQKDKIVIGCDTRKGSEKLKNAMIKVIPYVVDVGIATTPMIELAVREYNADGGIIITASHNPKEYNGFKFLRSDGAALSVSDMKRVIDNFKNNNIKINKNKKIIIKDKDIKKKIINFYLNLVKDIDLIKKSNFKIITDPNGGTAAVILDQILKKIKVKNIKKNYKLGEFNREIEPTEESLKYLISLKDKADFAIGFDCDADRAEIVTDKVIDGNYVLALVVDEILDKKKGNVVVNAATSSLIRDIAKKYNCKVKEVEVGEINVVDEMLKSNAVIGGEGSCSGAIVPPSKCRDGILTTLFILKLMARKGKSVNEIIDSYPKYYNIKDKVNFSVDLNKIKKYFLKKDCKIQKIGDGLKVIFDDSFLYFRASKTEDLFRIIADSRDKKTAKKLIELGKQVFDKYIFT